MVLQLLQSRLFSVTSWYHLSFLVISMAMFGLTAGALWVYKSNEEEQRKEFSLIARKHSIYFGFFIIIALIVQLYFPIVTEDGFKTLLFLPFVGITTGLAYYHAGIAITLCLTRAPFPIGTTYGVDLLGAGLGCIAALLLMEGIDTPSAILLTSACAFLAALMFRLPSHYTEDVKMTAYKIPTKKLAAGFAAVTLGLGLLNASFDRPFLAPLWVKGKIVNSSDIEYEKWNSISRVIIKKEAETVPFAWGASPIFPQDQSTLSKWLIIDGDAGTPITKFDGDLSKHSYLEFDVTNVAYSLPDIKRSAIIGVGGGRDLLSAKYFGVEEVTALDVNPVQIHVLTKHPDYKDYANLYKLPGVNILNHEARSWFRQNTEKFDLIQMSLIDTWAATGAGAFALSENGLYTVEAWDIFLNDLSDHGVFTLTRWSDSVLDDTGRLLSVAMATLMKQGIENPLEHIALIHSDIAINLVLAKSPFTEQQLKALKDTARDKEFEIVLMPDHVPSEGVLAHLINAKTMQDLHDISDKEFYDISPSTDMRPFFFNQARLSKPLDVSIIALDINQKTTGVQMGQAKATFNLYLIILFSLIMVALVIVIPLLKTVENKNSTYIKAGTVYFMLIGLGFMFVEISLLQALGIFLGHPIYGLSVVLFSLIIFAGIGSLTSEKLPLDNNVKQIAWSLITCVYAIVLALSLQDIFYSYTDIMMMKRILISVAIVAPAGFLMGFAFPTGLRLTEQFDTRSTAWFWGINGACGVLGSSLAMAFNIAFGIDKTLMLGGACYALLSLSFLFLNKKTAK